MVFSKKSLIQLFFLFVLFFNNQTIDCLSDGKKNSPEIDFLMSIKDMTADYEQEQYNMKNISLSTGKIVIKKPDNVLLTYNNGQMKIKIISINGNVKVFDEVVKQTTYISDNYSELIQFFTNNIKPEKIKKNKKGDLCILFNRFDKNFAACLRINLEKKTLLKINVFEEKKVNNNIKKNNTFLPVMSINFKNVKTNKGVKDSVFYVKDNRIFNENDEF